MEAVQSTQELQLVVFRLAKEEYGLPITKVQEINRLVPITKLPQTPSFMEGIINLRGRIIPVIDLRKRFSLAISEHNDDTRIIIVEVSGQTVGIIVDAVTEVGCLQLVLSHRRRPLFLMHSIFMVWEKSMAVCLFYLKSITSLPPRKKLP